MKFKVIAPSIFLASLPLSLLADTVIDVPEESGIDRHLASRPTARVPSYFLDYTTTSDTDFDDVDGGFSFTQLSIDGGICAPLKFNDKNTLIIKSTYERTDLETDTMLGDQDLHTLKVHFRWIYSDSASKWSWITLLSPGFSSDGGSLSSDDFSLNGVAGFGYKKSDKFSWLGGVAFFTNDFESRIFPGIGFRWRPADNAELEYTGIRLKGSWQPSDDWIYRFDARPGGGTWHIREGGEDLNVDVDSYQIGFGVERRLTEKLWLNLTGGVTVGNELEIESDSGKEIFREEAEAGWFAQIGVRLAVW